MDSKRLYSPLTAIIMGLGEAIRTIEMIETTHGTVADRKTAIGTDIMWYGKTHNKTGKSTESFKLTGRSALAHDIKRKDQPPKQYTIRLAATKRKPPIVDLTCAELVEGKCRFYADTGADGERKMSRIIGTVHISHVIIINGVMPGVCTILGRLNLEPIGLLCDVHIVSDDFPTDTDGFLGWDVFLKYDVR